MYQNVDDNFHFHYILYYNKICNIIEMHVYGGCIWCMDKKISSENKLLELNNKSHYYEKSITLYFWQHIDYNVSNLKSNCKYN